MVNTIQPGTENFVSSLSAMQLRAYLKSKDFVICSVTQITNSGKWFAILTKNEQFIIGTIFTGKTGVERIEESLM